MYARDFRHYINVDSGTFIVSANCNVYMNWPDNMFSYICNI